MKTVKSLSKRTIIIMISTILLNAFSALTAPIFTRILTTSDFGVFSVFNSWMGILAILFSLSTHGTLNNAKVELEKEDYLNYCFNCFILSMTAGALLGSLFVLGRNGLSVLLKLSPNCIIWLVIATLGTCVVNFGTKYLIIEMQVVQKLILSLAIAFISTILSVFFILFLPFEGYYGRIIGVTTVYVLAAVCIVVFVFKFKNVNIRIDYWKYCLKLSLPLVIHSVSGVLLAQCDRIMLMSRKGSSVAGIYSFCYTVALPISALASAINSSWTPEYFLLMKEEKRSEIKMHYNRLIFLMATISCGYMLIAPEVLKILSVEEYWKGIDVIPLVIMGYFFNFIYFFPVNYEFYNKKTKYIGASTLGAAVINMVLNHLLIPYYGMNGAALATIASYIVLFIVHEIISRVVIKGYDVNWKIYLKGIVPIGICYFYCIIFKENIWMRWFLGILLGMVFIAKVVKQKSLI